LSWSFQSFQVAEFKDFSVIGISPAAAVRQQFALLSSQQQLYLVLGV